MSKLDKRQMTELRYRDIIGGLDVEIDTMINDTKGYGIKSFFTIHRLMKTRRHYVDILAKSIRKGADEIHDSIQSD